MGPSMRLRLIYSGGTVGCTGSPLTPLPATEFQRLWQRHAAPALPDGLDVAWRRLDSPVDSSAMGPADWGRLARMVLTAEPDESVMLLHGTDTLAWTAAALAFLLTLYDDAGAPVARLSRPVVLTGAQRPLFEGDGLRPDTDALDNIRTGINAFATNRPEVMVAFGGLILRGTRITKMSTTDDRAFAYPKGAASCPPLPPAEAKTLAAQIEAVAPHLGKRAVVSLTATPADAGLMADQLTAIIDKLGEKLGAIHLIGYGIGNFPAEQTLAPLLHSAHERGVLLAAGSQVTYGDIDPSTYGAGHWLGGCGAMATADMATPAVQAKLNLALALGAAKGWDRAAMERYFVTPVAAERRA